MTTESLYYLLKLAAGENSMENWNFHYDWLMQHDYVYGDSTKSTMRLEDKGKRFIDALQTILACGT